MLDASFPALSKTALGDLALATSLGAVKPDHTWSLVQQAKAVLVDVRTAEERKFVSVAPRGVHVAWATGITTVGNPNVVRDPKAKCRKN